MPEIPLAITPEIVLPLMTRAPSPMRAPRSIVTRAPIVDPASDLHSIAHAR